MRMRFLAVAACDAARGSPPARLGAVVRAVRRQGHPRRRHAAHRGRHGVQLPAGQGRRDHDRREGAAGDPRPVRDRLLPGRAPRSRERRAGGDRRGAAGDRADRLRRHEGVRDGQGREGAARASASPRAASSTARCSTAPSRSSSASTSPAAVRGRGADHGHAARAQPRRASTSPSTEGEVAKIRAINIVGNKAFSENELLDLFVLRTPGWLTWYTKNRPVLAAEARRRPGDAALVLPEPRLPRLQHRLDAGLDHARQARHLHHGQRHRRREVHRLRRAARRAAAGAARGAGEAGHASSPASVFSREAADRTTKAITDRLGNDGYAFANANAMPEDRQGQAHGRVHHHRRPGPARVRAAHQRRRQHQDARRGGAPRDAPARGRVLRRLEDPALASRRIDRTQYFSEVDVETPPVAESRRPGRRHLHGQGEADRRAAVRRSASRAWTS